MSDEEVVERLRRALHTEAEMLTPHQGTPRVTPVAVRQLQRTRLRTAGYVVLAVAAAVAAAVVIGVNAGHHGSGARVDVSSGPSGSSQSSSPRVQKGAMSAAGTTPNTVKAATMRPVVTTTTPTTLAPRGTTNASNKVHAATRAARVGTSFVPLSATFVSLTDGWVAGVTDCKSDSGCIKLAVTTDRGDHWKALTGPSIPGYTAPSASNGYSRPDLQIRFANPQVGWLFGVTDGGSFLYSTSDGGASWAEDSLTGLPVKQIIDLETANQRVQMTYVSSNGGVGLATAPVPSNGTAISWTVPSLNEPASAQSADWAQLVVQGDRGWLLETSSSGGVVGGADLVNGTWTDWQPPACSGQSGLLAAATTDDLTAVCGATGHQVIMKSTDGGATFTSAGASVGQTPVTTLASSRDTLALLGLSNGTVKVVPQSTTRSPLTTTGRARGTILQVGFEDSTNGILITGSDDTGQLSLTSDGGRHWDVTNLNA